LIEYKKAIEPVQVLENESTHEKIKIINRYDCIMLDHLKCEWSVVGDGFTRPKKEIELPKGIKPGQTAELSIEDLDITELPGECYVEINFTLKRSTNWADVGFEVAFGQVPIKPPTSLFIIKSLLPPTSDCPMIKSLSASTIEISTRTAVWTFDKVLGQLSSWRKATTSSSSSTLSGNLLASPPILSFYRACTDNDRPQDGNDWLNSRLQQASPHTLSFSLTSHPGTSSVQVVVTSRIAPPVFEWSIDCITTYVFRGGSVAISVKGHPRGLRLPPTLSRIGLEFALSKDIDHAQWLGRGPGESYSDTKMAQRFGRWSSPIEDLYTKYEWPQESGNRTDVRWVRFTSGESGGDEVALKASFGDRDGCSFTAHHYTTKDLDECVHDYELRKRKREDVQVRLDWRHHGIGSGSCGPRTGDAYRLNTGDFEGEVLLE
jgi:beta-galactosidase